MEKNNNVISGFQFVALSFFLSGSIFVGLGINSMFSLAGRDIWITVLLGLVLSIIPTILFIYIFNYRPDLNIFEKNKVLFGKVIGYIINFILCIFVYYMMMLVMWSITNLSITMYLTKTPEDYIAATFVLAAAYAVFKGIEGISRTAEILFYIALIFIIVTSVSLSFQFNSSFFKPVLEHGFKTALSPVVNLLAYLFSPLIIMTIIPKNSLKESKHSKWYIIAGFFIGIIFIVNVFIMTAGVISPELSSFYRFPAYYVQRKVSIGGAINNLENLLSLHWFFNSFLLTALGIHFISKFTQSVIKIKSINIKNIIILVISLSLVFTQKLAFHDTASAIKFMKYNFPLVVGLPLIIIIIIIIILIYIKRRKQRQLA